MPGVNVKTESFSLRLLISTMPSGVSTVDDPEKQPEANNAIYWILGGWLLRKIMVISALKTSTSISK